MSFSWTFKEAGPGDRARESQVEKFFNSDAVANRANAIVREGIQNSLDAAPDQAVVRVRIAIGSWSAAETEHRLPLYVKGFNEHFHVEAVRAIVADPPAPGEPFRYLVFEDFGTSGLTGDLKQWWPDENGQPNPFFNYFRAEGISDKHEGARGRHGAGRLVFMFASRVRSIFGLTRRADDGGSEELLMGTSVLRNHRIGQTPYLPDGLFGPPDDDDPRLILPIREDAAFITKFKSDFGVSRQNENGLSVVVPWLYNEVTASEIVKAVLFGYFYPILRKKLVVEVVAESGAMQVIDADTIDSIVDAQAAEIVAPVQPVIALARASLAVAERIQVAATGETGALKWNAANIADPAREAIHDKLEAGELVAVRVEMPVRPKGKPAAGCFFDVFLQRHADVNDGQILFIREGIIVTDVRPRRTPGIRALVVVDEGPLASFLGDSENPTRCNAGSRAERSCGQRDF